MRRRLTSDEEALWAKVASTVTPMKGRRIIPPRNGEGDRPKDGGGGLRPSPALKESPLHPAAAHRGPPPRSGEAYAPPTRALDRHGLDTSWERKLTRGVLQPDFTLDLHGATLDAAYMRLEHGLTQALAQGARVVLLITGRPRPSDGEAGRGERRGAIRAKFLDWLSAGSHASRIAAIRPAHPRHGGAGAVYIVLRRPR